LRDIRRSLPLNYWMIRLDPAEIIHLMPMNPPTYPRTSAMFAARDNEERFGRCKTRTDKTITVKVKK
jgi:hypothetical protein